MLTDMPGAVMEATGFIRFTGYIILTVGLSATGIIARSEPRGDRAKTWLTMLNQKGIQIPLVQIAELPSLKQAGGDVRMEGS